MSVTTMTKRILPIRTDPKIMSGVPVFAGTRVPVRTLFDYLADGCSLVEFLDNFPTVKKGQAEQLLDFAMDRVLEEAEAL